MSTKIKTLFLTSCIIFLLFLVLLPVSFAALRGGTTGGGAGSGAAGGGTGSSARGMPTVKMITPGVAPTLTTILTYDTARIIFKDKYYDFKVNFVSPDRAVINILEKNVDLILGKETKIDLDGDNKEDVAITLIKTAHNLVDLSIMLIEAPLTQVPSEITGMAAEKTLAIPSEGIVKESNILQPPKTEAQAKRSWMIANKVVSIALLGGLILLTIFIWSKYKIKNRF